MICPICETCNSSATLYTKCIMCDTVYTTKEIFPITENDNSGARNTEELMDLRLNRMLQVMSVNTVIDFGCGKGLFTDFLNGRGILAWGIDIHTYLNLSNIVLVDAVFMIEVIEHLINPKETIKEIASKLNPNGILYIETTFSDMIEDYNNHSYVSPDIGHRTILSRKALELIAKAANLTILPGDNPNVAILKKT